MGSIFGGQSKDTTTTVKYPKWVDQAAQQTFGQAQQAAGRPYPTYDYARIAGFNPDELASFNLARSNTGNWQPAYGAAFSSALGATQPVGQQDISAYMNPYTQDVINTTLDELYRQNNRQLIDTRAAMAKRGSYLNEDRRGVIENLQNESTNRIAAQTTAALQSQAFSEALAQANAQRNRQLSAAGQFQNLAPIAQTLGQGDVAGLNVIGGQQRQLEQQNLDLAYSDYLRQFGYPQEQIDYLLNALRATPYGQSTTSPQAAANPFGSALGGGLAGYAVAGNPWGAAIGGGLGFLSSL